ncbi:MAG: hypothetical protein ACR2QK_00030, partial [Acidimicrobiales bacterium]
MRTQREFGWLLVSLGLVVAAVGFVNPAAGEDRTGGDDAADHGGGVRELTVIATGLDNPRGLDLRGTR